MRIHTDHNGLAVNAISRLADGTDVAGHHYQVLVGSEQVTIDFQRGPVKDNGVNGLTNEALLAILIDRTKQLDDKFPCKENKEAIHHMGEALAWLNKRTAARLQQGVEGTNVAHQPAAEQISGQPTHVAILRTALGAMLGGETEAELAQVEQGIDAIASVSDPEDVGIARQAIAAMRQTVPGTIEPAAGAIAVGMKLDASVAIGQVQEAQTGLQLLAKVRAFIEKHSLGCPESLFQRDNPQIDALTVMGDLCEIAGWKKEDEDGE